MSTWQLIEDTYHLPWPMIASLLAHDLGGSSLLTDLPGIEEMCNGKDSWRLLERERRQSEDILGQHCLVLCLGVVLPSLLGFLILYLAYQSHFYKVFLCLNYFEPGKIVALQLQTLTL